mmetsp:Transcript_35312/g.79720  ORF Transcript_35312/g.79720 Transcript_35312/m.79720 type:complete len:196 (+) Transcript_35312:85-672(+)
MGAASAGSVFCAAVPRPPCSAADGEMRFVCEYDINMSHADNEVWSPMQVGNTKWEDDRIDPWTKELIDNSASILPPHMNCLNPESSDDKDYLADAAGNAKIMIDPKLGPILLEDHDHRSMGDHIGDPAEAADRLWQDGFGCQPEACNLRKAESVLGPSTATEKEADDKPLGQEPVRNLLSFHEDGAQEAEVKFFL